MPSKITHKTTINSGGILTLLGATLVILKALNLIEMSWWAATLPFWIGPAIVVSIIVAVIVALIFAAIVFGIGYGFCLLYCFLSEHRNKRK